MGQVFSPERAKELRDEQVQKIIDRVFDHFTVHTGREYLTVQDLYTAILLVYNDINKYLPGPHQDPPSRENVDELLKTYDTNKDGFLDRKEFNIFIKHYTTHLASQLSKSILIFSIAAPCLAMLSKNASERVPVVGPVVRKIPNAIYASIITAFIAVVSNLNDSV